VRGEADESHTTNSRQSSSGDLVVAVRLPQNARVSAWQTYNGARWVCLPTRRVLTMLVEVVVCEVCDT
jgi:hypothetical protein